MAAKLWHKTTCTFSKEQPRPLYRYRLRRWMTGENRRGTVVFLLLNPSTADESKDDPTVRRCVGYAHDWGYEYLDVLNLFAYRDTDPDALLRVNDPIGPDNDRHIMEVARAADLLVCAWGSHKAVNGRAEHVAHMLLLANLKPMALKLTKDGMPGHALYLKADLKPFPLA